jgi:hypothetical protein
MRYNLHEEKTIIRLAKVMQETVYRTFKFDPACQRTLCQHIETINELHKDVSETFGRKHKTITCSNFFKLYEGLKDINMLAVVAAETVLAAEKAGYRFCMLQPEEREAAKENLKEYQSYIAYKKTTEHLTEGKLEMPVVLINKPFAMFEKYNEKHYLGMIASSSDEDTNLFILSQEALLVLHTTDLYDPGIGDHKEFIKEHFEC